MRPIALNEAGLYFGSGFSLLSLGLISARVSADFGLSESDCVFVGREDLHAVLRGTF